MNRIQDKKRTKEQMKDITETNTQNNPNKILIPT